MLLVADSGEEVAVEEEEEGEGAGGTWRSFKSWFARSGAWVREASESVMDADLEARRIEGTSL